MHELDKVLQHAGVKGMKWGVRRDRNRPGGADGKEESTKAVDKRGKLRMQLDSLKRERQWGKVIREMDKLSTKDIVAVNSRVRLENDLKSLSRSKVGNPKDKKDYLRREHMSDAELKRKVVRLRAKEQLKKSVSDASKEQREFGEKVVNVGKTVAIKYALTKSITPKDILVAVQNPKDTSKQAQADLQKAVLTKIASSAKSANKKP